MFTMTVHDLKCMKNVVISREELMLNSHGSLVQEESCEDLMLKYS